ncbi:triacylglycerol lipase [Sporothrix schenckii 1099-18]|uniref:triacylglycerol lipase n=1 Tax=Sporothrix schenckii 1099-18 TaxID=1397361 RepID=A0A0F2LY39_SPOSC|nr:triacylglycerol lipase [Sporothrix schenckii 1099-18]KJR82373.1 triacylglycerol lipase [Sporothrix schenckii 1099-18]
MSQQYPSRGKSKPRCTSAGRVTAQVLLSFLAFSTTSLSASAGGSASEQLVLPLPPAGHTPVLAPEPPAPADHVFTLRHIYHHGTHRYPRLHRKLDILQRDADVWLAAEDGYARHRLPTLHAKSQAAPLQRLVDRHPSVVDPMVALAREQGYVTVLSPDAWTVDSVPMPNVTDKTTVLNMAYMASNAYVETPGQPDWDDVGQHFNRSSDFGWEGDGLRGHVFADATNSTIVIGLKGTSLAVFDGEGTTTNDKENDNLFFSCCCAQQGQWTYRQVCNCATGTYACNNTCVRKALQEENRYYMAARELYANVSAEYPDANIWLTGHSLGGAVTSFLGLTYGLPVVTFQAVPEALAAGRLGLPVPPGADPDFPQTREHIGAFHFGHTADPIYIGTCNGATASCSYAGYALESACHAGYECVYDVVADKGWRVGVGTHKIRTVIHDILLPYDTVPECKSTPECRDCANWKMYESNGTESTTTSTSATSTKTKTRTQTCKTPGWWGCLDETTTTTTGITTTRDVPTTSTTTTSETRTTTTCATPGRFWGCLDETESLSTSTSTSTSTSISSKTSPVSADPSTTKTSPRMRPSPTETSSTCSTPGRFWGCWDEAPATTSTSTQTSTITPPPTGPTAPVAPVVPPVTTTPPTSKQRCLQRSWLGFCREWGVTDEL